MLYDCRDIGGYLEIPFLWIHPIHQNLCRTQWPRVGNNIDYRDNRFVYYYVIVPLQLEFKSLKFVKYSFYEISSDGGGGIFLDHSEM